MATASIVQLQAVDKPQFYRPPISQSSTDKANELLQDNHERHYIFFNADGFHNHIAHQLLTIWSLGATPEELQRGYDTNKSYQRPARKPESTIVQGLQDPATFISHLGVEQHYNDFLEFFRQEIDKKGWQHVLKQYVFAGDERAETMLVRMFAGLLHPIIHLGFGLEFQQPAIIAEALAQAACHDDWIGEVLLPAEEAAKKNGNNHKTIVELIQEIHNHKEIREAPRWSDSNKIRDGLLARAAQPLIDIISQIRIAPEAEAEEKEKETITRKTAEMTHAAILLTAGAQRAHKAIKFDFFLMHSVNATIFWPILNRQAWLSPTQKTRLLEWKIRFDLVLYASRKSPEIRRDEIRGYTPKVVQNQNQKQKQQEDHQEAGWDNILKRACRVDDDGHAAKLVRAVANGEQVCRAFEGQKGFELAGEDWLKLGYMVIDSVEMEVGERWVRNAGFEEAWENIPERGVGGK